MLAGAANFLSARPVDERRLADGPRAYGSKSLRNAVHHRGG
jgi:hypothetical protein